MTDATKSPHGPLRVGIGGPVGAGKTALMDQLCKRMRDRWQVAAITNDIYTREDAEFLMRCQALPLERIIGVETGGCPHTAIREDASINLAAVDELMRRFPDLDIILIELGGDNLSATFSPELADLTLYVIDVAAGDKIPRKGGPGVTRSDLLIINKIDLAPHVGASLDVMDRDARRMRGERPFRSRRSATASASPRSSPSSRRPAASSRCSAGSAGVSARAGWPPDPRQAGLDPVGQRRTLSAASRPSGVRLYSTCGGTTSCATRSTSPSASSHCSVCASIRSLTPPIARRSFAEALGAASRARSAPARPSGW